jgi:hypothetical protein
VVRRRQMTGKSELRLNRTGSRDPRINRAETIFLIAARAQSAELSRPSRAPYPDTPIIIRRPTGLPCLYGAGLESNLG